MPRRPIDTDPRGYRRAGGGSPTAISGLILDSGGDSSLSRLRRALTPRGTLVIADGAVAGKWLGLGRRTRAVALSPFVRQRLTTFIAKQRHGDMETLAELIEAGRQAG